MRIKDVGEIGLIESLAKSIRLDKSVVKGVGDDTAVIRWTKDKYLLFTCDMLIEDVHFKLKSATPFQIGWKALASSVSDIAAMGGVPRHALVSVGINPNLPRSFLDNLYKGLKAVAARFKINIVGGDTNKSEKLIIDVSLLGEVEKQNIVTRRGAKIGDVILVTGSLGGSIKGRHLNFIPRLAEARSLVKGFKISSMIDISDGLVLDLGRILNASSVGARIYQNTIPVSKDADSPESALYDGEDFELLFTMSVKEAKRFFRAYLAKMETPVTLIGEILAGRGGYKLIDENGIEKKLRARGYLHF